MSVLATKTDAVAAVLNRHPVDELADVRAQIRELQDREAALRQQILTGKCGLVGDDYRARIRQMGAERLDVGAVRAHYKPDELLPFTRNVVTTAVFLNRRK
jgi:hypothetical protein